MAQTDKMKQTLDKLEAGVRDFYTSEKFLTYLQVMSRFHNYSLNNQILIAAQMPEATIVAGYNSWMRNFERHVKKGERSITILAPQKIKIKVDTDKTDEYGNVIQEEKEGIKFRPVSVFDVSQTEGKPLPELATELTGEVSRYEQLLNAARQAAPYPIEVGAVEGSAKGWCNFTQKKIIIKEGMSEAQTLKTAFHETAHARIHAGDTDKSREQKEVEAESIAYVVCSHFGLDTSDYSFGYVATWAGRQDINILKQSMQTISQTAKAIITDVERAMEEPELTVSGKSKEEIAQDVKDAFADQGHPEASVYVADSRIDGDKERVTVVAAYKGEESEQTMKQILADSLPDLSGTALSVVPVNQDEVKEQADFTKNMTDTSWPMVTILTSTEPEKLQPGAVMNIYEAAAKFKTMENGLRLEGKNGYTRFSVEYTYLGMTQKIIDSAELGSGRRNFLDYMDISPDVCTYLKRHVQVLETMTLARNENAVGKTGGLRQAHYEDMIYEWAEGCRLQLNYKSRPEIPKPPEYAPQLVRQYDRWEVVR